MSLFRSWLVCFGLFSSIFSQAQILNTCLLDQYVDQFNENDEELYTQYVSNAESKEFLRKNIPLFECPDETIEEVYYFRWWTYRKHIKQTPEGFIITEFLPNVSWAGKYNGICCPAWFHFREGRWIHNKVYLTDYADYWLKGGGALRSYSFPVADALNQYSLVLGEKEELEKYFPELLENYYAWKKEKFVPNVGLFWQIDGEDGMEVSVGGSGYRATINSYMAADAIVLSELATEQNDSIATILSNEAKSLKENIFQKLWDKDAEFLKVLPKGEEYMLKDVRELHGYTPWAFSLADENYAVAWKYLMDTNYFLAPYGLTTAEQCHPGFKVVYEGHECQWNGPSWPFATSMTLIALANLLNEQNQRYVSNRDYYTLLSIYARSQYRLLENRLRIPWIDENLNPYTGDWLSRTMLLQNGSVLRERGRDYNHSSFCDLVITGLIGLRPREDNILVVNPQITEGMWDYFCLDNILYHGKIISIVYDKTGEKYSKGKGFFIFVDGQRKAFSPVLSKMKVEL